MDRIDTRNAKRPVWYSSSNMIRNAKRLVWFFTFPGGKRDVYRSGNMSRDVYRSGYMPMDVYRSSNMCGDVYHSGYVNKSYLLPILLLLAFWLFYSVDLSARSAWNAPGDTLTVIMRPILNVPEIIVPGEILNITTIAPINTNSWQAALIHGQKRIPLQVSNPVYNSTFSTWNLQCEIPPVAVYELYDLELSGSGGIFDITQNAVQVIPTRKTSYYFVHITDLHLPNRLYYPNAGYDTDSTAVNDFRAVIDDINLIRPEFVLLTGDLINEGELEGFAGQYWYGWTQRLLGLIEVPVYVVSGNHDTGGWNSTPPPAGSARKNWWRYFGWKWNNNTSTSWNYHTQDYSFKYGNIHYIGLEAYDNYDNWRYNIYGANSFTSNQMAWLNLEVNAYPGATKALFYHYDFDEELSLSALGVNLALWGHVHYNTGSIYTQPYSLATRSVCDGNRAYRIIKVNGNNFIPLSTIYAGSDGNNIHYSFFPSNTGVADSVMCTIVNNQSQAFDNSLIRFVMPAGNASYSITGGVLEQVDSSTEHNICYVKVNLLPGITRYVSIKVNPVSASDLSENSPQLMVTSIYPNPFVDSQSFVLAISKGGTAKLEVFSVKGQKVREISYEGCTKGNNYLSWDGKDATGSSLPAGIYFLRWQVGGHFHSQKVLKI